MLQTQPMFYPRCGTTLIALAVVCLIHSFTCSWVGSGFCLLQWTRTSCFRMKRTIKLYQTYWQGPNLISSLLLCTWWKQLRPTNENQRKAKKPKRQAWFALPWQWALQSPASAAVVTLLSTLPARQWLYLFYFFCTRWNGRSLSLLPIFSAFASRTGSSLHVRTADVSSSQLQAAKNKRCCVSSEEEQQAFIKVMHLFLG